MIRKFFSRRGNLFVLINRPKIPKPKIRKYSDTIHEHIISPMSTINTVFGFFGVISASYLIATTTYDRIKEMLGLPTPDKLKELDTQVADYEMKAVVYVNHAISLSIMNHLGIKLDARFLPPSRDDTQKEICNLLERTAALQEGSDVLAIAGQKNMHAATAIAGKLQEPGADAKDVLLAEAGQKKGSGDAPKYAAKTFAGKLQEPGAAAKDVLAGAGQKKEPGDAPKDAATAIASKLQEPGAAAKDDLD